MKIENIGGKIIGIGDVTVLPGEAKDVPEAYRTSPILEVYRVCGMAKITGDASASAMAGWQDTAENAPLDAGSVGDAAGKSAGDAAEKAAEDAGNLRQARLASLNGISDDGLAKLADELGINPAKCKDQADVMKKVRAALKK